ncbi:hypothetical protein L3X38_032298 [Prunus dulcis]|uniref:Uncharacterized protein n=1 Tax=Prunus dulcis TaxID=3755 RepID=A0AAD4YVS3_PRUDU|nr:hypothetical protein L3X38_032298 [Prunus dulcis]
MAIFPVSKGLRKDLTLMGQGVTMLNRDRDWNGIPTPIRPIATTRRSLSHPQAASSVSILKVVERVAVRAEK